MERRLKSRISRRELLRRVVVRYAPAAGSLLLVACGVATNRSTPTAETQLTAEQNTFQKRLEGALSYMETSNNQTLIKIVQFIKEQQLLPDSKKAFQITSKSPDSPDWIANDPEPIDLYFKPELVQTDKEIIGAKANLVISPEFLDKNNISDEELAVIIAQKARVYSAVNGTIFSEITKKHQPSVDDIQGQLSSKDTLEKMLWWGIANQVIAPLDRSGRLTSNRLRVLIPDRVYTDFSLVDPSEWQNWAANLPPTIFPGLSQK